MSSVHHILPQNRNLIASAVLAATNTNSSSAFRRTAVSRSGNGVISLSGPFTGSEESDIDIEITATSGAERISEDTFVGVGTGAMSEMAAQAGATPQTYTVTLIDTGTTTAAAVLDLEGVTLEAQSSGAGGNDINLTVDQSGLTFTATDFSLLADLAEGTTEITGNGWNWDTAAGTGDNVPSTAKRVCIGDDRSVIYRQWRTYADGEWSYRFLPAIQRDYKAGERVYEVTGSRSVTLTDGVTPESYSSIVTLYDLLADIQDSSDLVAVDGVVSAAETADNPMGVVDLRTRTDAHVAWTSGTGSRHARGFINHSAGSGANTEIVTARCYANTRAEGSGVGREKWKLDGSVSGDLGEIVTGDAYVSPTAAFGLTIPTRLPDGYGEPRGDIGAQVAYASKDEDSPPICVDALRLGSNAEDKTVTFYYRQRPTGSCDCEDVSYSRLANLAKCLDIDPTEEIDMTALAAGHAARVSDIQSWHADFVKANTELDSTNKEVFTAIHDIALADGVRSLLLQALSRIYLEGVRSWDAWSGGATITKHQVVEPTTANGYKYVAQGAGTTHASTEPTWPTTVDNTVVDNDITWKCKRKPEEEWDDLLSDIDTELAGLEAIETNYADYESVPMWQSSTAYTRGNIIRPGFGSTPTEPGIYSILFVCIDGGTSAGATAYYNPGGYADYDGFYPGRKISDGTVQWMCLGELPFWSNSDINLGDNLNNKTGPGNGMYTTVIAFLNRYRGQADFVVASAELLPNFNSADTTGTLTGSECWRDPGLDYWWEPEGTAYMPAFTNYEYVSVVASSLPGYGPQPTHEFSFVIKLAESCIDNLEDGDSVTITIGDAGWEPTYQVGDELHMATVGAAALYLGGGVTGNDTFTWQVGRSVDGVGTDYSQDLTTPALYDDGDVQFRINAGGISHALGDYFTLCVEDSTFKWRQDGGAWSASLDIQQTSLADGIKAEFAEGSCASFVSADSASFTALQPYAVSNAATPSDQTFTWSGASTTITATITGAVDAIMIAMHTLPSGCSVNVADGVALNSAMTWREGPMVLLLDSTLTNPTLTFTVTSATGGSIGWLWAGASLNLSRNLHVQQRKRAYSVLAGGGINALHTLAGSGNGAVMSWIGGLTETDSEDLIAAADNAQENGGWPLAIVPHEDHLDEAMLVRAPDEIAFGDFHQFMLEDGVTARCISTSIDFRPWLTAP